ncbi:hypothetical protein V8E55_006589 [Tylopilus felleus]
MYSTRHGFTSHHAKLVPMSDSFQDVYAKHLPSTPYGYPLRMPEPMSTLPQDYQDDGLQIGDVGIVGKDGQFDVLFNICKDSDNTLHDFRGVPENFQPVQQGLVKFSKNAISPGSIHTIGITRIFPSWASETRSAEYEFASSIPAGAILILPLGAESIKLLSPGQFREVATKSAVDWYEFAKKHYGVQRLDRSLYLITGFYKARSWSLGSFNDPTATTGRIRLERDNENPTTRLLQFTFNGDRRHSVDNNSANQSVFVTGYRISFSEWLADHVVLGATESETTWSIVVRVVMACLKWFRSSPSSHEVPATIRTSLEHSPTLTQPFHPADTINRFLLSKNPNATVAITHDSQWMEMTKEGLREEDLLQEDRLETFLSRHFTIVVEPNHGNSTISLQGKADDTKKAVSDTNNLREPPPEIEIPSPSASEFEASRPPTPELEILPSTTPVLEFSPPATPSLDNPWTVITRIRAQNIHFGLKRIPAGFYVLVQFDGAQRRTQNKSIRLSGSGIEWEDEILLPSKMSDKVRFTVYASFELEPMLGNGECLYTSESHVEKLLGGTYLITFSTRESETTALHPSLLITLGRRYSDHPAVAPSGDDSNLESEESSDLVRETTLGQEALLRYYNEYRREDLESAVQHFECAWLNCPLTHRCRAVVLVNLGKAKFVRLRIDLKSTDFNELILLYRNALTFRPPGHLDRPVTLLQIAQILLFRYEQQGCNESVANKIRELVTEPQTFSENSHEYRAADLILDTLERCRVVNSGSASELGELVQRLKRSAAMPPDGYFDRPQRLINLGITLWRRYEEHRDHRDLEHSSEKSEQALQLLPSRHPDRFLALRTLTAISWELFQIRGNVSHLEKLSALCEEALQLIPGRHHKRIYCDASSTSYLVEASERFGDTASEAEDYYEAFAQLHL